MSTSLLLIPHVIHRYVADKTITTADLDQTSDDDNSFYTEFSKCIPLIALNMMKYTFLMGISDVHDKLK